MKYYGDNMKSEKYHGTEKYYGFLDEVEVIAETVFIRFDCINIEYFKKINNSKDINNFSTVIIETQFNANDFIIKEDMDLWKYIELDDNGYEAKFYASFFEEGEPIKIKIQDVNSSEKLSLNELISLNGITDSSENEIIKELNKRKEIKTICVYNVGQGNCNALCDSRCVPILYFDFGGGIARNAKTYNKNMKFCFTYAPPIILSHWDFDHWASALNASKNNESYDMKWIVPRQKLGPNSLKHALNLNNKGNLLIFPNNINKIDINLGSILRGKGRSINDSGLNFVAKIKLDNGELTTLFPGDCDYNHIHNISKYQFDGLVASHHGGHIPTYKIKPKNSNINRIVYSYGNGNTYNHPSPNAEAQYSLLNWSSQYRLNSPAGHVLLFPLPYKPVMPCGGLCDLKPVQN